MQHFSWLRKQLGIWKQSNDLILIGQRTFWIYGQGKQVKWYYAISKNIEPIIFKWFEAYQNKTKEQKTNYAPEAES